MSNVYSTEPPTRGKVVLHTTHGSLDVELWPREAPLAARNFAKLALEGYYDGVAFHRLINGFMLQGGDPQEGQGDTGAKGHIYEPPSETAQKEGKEKAEEGAVDAKLAAAATRGAAKGGFRDEPHSRLRFARRGLVACANSNVPHSNGAQFFLTLGPCEWLDKKHTIFGRVAGDTVFNLERLAAASEATGPEHDDRPAALLPGGDPREAPRVLRAEVTHAPFEDLGPPRPGKAAENAARRARREAKWSRGGGGGAGGAAAGARVGAGGSLAAGGGRGAKTAAATATAAPATLPTGKRNLKLLSFGEDEDEDEDGEEGEDEGGALLPASKKPKRPAGGGGGVVGGIQSAHAALAGADPALARPGAEEEDPETRMRLEQREAWEREQRRRREEAALERAAAAREQQEQQEAGGGGGSKVGKDAFEASMRARAEAAERERRERLKAGGKQQQQEEEDKEAAAVAAAEGDGDGRGEHPPPPPAAAPSAQQHQHHQRGAAGRKAAAEGARPVADAELLRPWHARRGAYLQRRRAVGGREDATLARLAAFTSALRGGGGGSGDGDGDGEGGAAGGGDAKGGRAQEGDEGLLQEKGAAANARPEAEEDKDGYDGRVDSRLDHLMPAAWRIDRLLMEEEGEEGEAGKGGGALDVARLARQRLMFARGGAGAGAAADDERDDDYVVDDPRAGGGRGRGGGGGGGGGGRGGRGGGGGGGGGGRPRSGKSNPWERGRVVG